MTGTTVRILARIQARPAKTAELATALGALVAPTRAEPGCLRYELLQAADDPACFVFVEEWSDRSAIDAHMASAHVQAASAVASMLLAAPPEIRTYHVLA